MPTSKEIVAGVYGSTPAVAKPYVGQPLLGSNYPKKKRNSLEGGARRKTKRRSTRRRKSKSRKH
jgi:hypothetical protein